MRFGSNLTQGTRPRTAFLFVWTINKELRDEFPSDQITVFEFMGFEVLLANWAFLGKIVGVAWTWGVKNILDAFAAVGVSVRMGKFKGKRVK